MVFRRRRSKINKKTEPKDSNVKADPTPAKPVPAKPVPVKSTPVVKKIKKKEPFAELEKDVPSSEPALVGALAPFNGKLPEGRVFWTNEYLNRQNHTSLTLKDRYDMLSRMYQDKRAYNASDPSLEKDRKHLEELRAVLKALGY